MKIKKNKVPKITDRQVSPIVKTLLSLRDVRGSNLGSVKSGTVSPMARHRYTTFFWSCVAQAL